MQLDRLIVVAVALLGTAAVAAAPQSQPAATQPAASVPHYNLRQLVSMARATYPGVAAARHAITAMERDVFRARWAWVPNFNMTGIVAPAPELRCFRTDPLTGQEIHDTKDCTHTNDLSVNSFKIAGVLARIELQIGMPLYTFGKLAAAKRAALAGVEVREAQLRGAEDKLEVDVTKAYWGLKLAREILFTVRDGRGYVVDAEKNIEKDLEEDTGEYTMTDLLRVKTMLAEIDARIPEAEKLERLTEQTLRLLTGQRNKPFEVDTTVLEAIGGEPMPVDAYVKVASTHRPDLKLLEAAVHARHASVDLERARFYPDLLFVAMVSYAYSSSIDQPQNAFYNNPFNYSLSGGFGLAVNWKLEPLLQWGSLGKAKAEEKETNARRSEGALGVRLDIFKAHADLIEARKRMEVSKGGEKAARRWLVATSQNLAAGLSETRDLTDALVGYFQVRLRYLQAMYDVNVGWAELGRAIGARPASR